LVKLTLVDCHRLEVCWLPAVQLKRSCGDLAVLSADRSGGKNWHETSWVVSELLKSVMKITWICQG